jgi:dTDP-4-amino-4,6-dideoxygalactose transaminase
LGYKPGDLPVTERLAKRILSLPMFPELTDEQIDEVIKEIRQFCHEHVPSAVSTLSKVTTR